MAIAFQTPAWLQRRKRWYTVIHLPYFSLVTSSVRAAARMANSSAQGADAFVGAQGLQERSDLFIRQGRMVTGLLYLSTSWQEMVEMAFPASRVRAHAVLANGRPVED